MQLYFLITGIINAATDFALLALVSLNMEKLDAILENKVLKKATTGAADPVSLASENQPAAKARLNGDIHHRPLVSLLTLAVLAPSQISSYSPPSQRLRRQRNSPRHARSVRQKRRQSL